MEYSQPETGTNAQYYTAGDAPHQQLPDLLYISVDGSPHTFEVPVRQTMLIGREDPDQRIKPDIDLTVFRAYQRGVSRRHAMITTNDNRLMLIGLNHSAGTAINGTELVPGEAAVLTHGDKLTVGGIHLQIGFAYRAHYSGV